MANIESSPQGENTSEATPKGILPFQGRGDARAYEAYALYVWSQRQKGEHVEPYGGRGDIGAIDAYAMYVVSEMEKSPEDEKLKKE